MMFNNEIHKLFTLKLMIKCIKLCLFKGVEKKQKKTRKKCKYKPLEPLIYKGLVGDV